MAKTIKAIVCPTCGSNKKTEIKPDYFVCESCKTEYYLDSDDINIIHTNKSSPTYTPPVLKNPKPALITGIFLAFCAFIFLSYFFSQNATTGHTFRVNNGTKEPELDDDQMVLVTNKNNDLIFVTVGLERTGSYENRNEKLVAYFDDTKGKQLKKQELNFSIPKNKASSPFKEKYMSNGDCYIIFNEKELFKVDPDLLEIEELKQDFFHAPELANGIAKLEKQYQSDGFKIQTLDGKSYVFYPLIDRVFAADQLRDEEKKVPPNAVNTTMFKFTSSTSGPVAHLVKYVLKIQVGYPYDDVYFELKDGRPEVRFKPDNLISYEAFLPERAFFNSLILGYNKDLLVILFTLDGNSSSSKQVQALDTKTGAIKWTFDCSTLDKHVNYVPYRALSNPQYTIWEANFGGMVIDNLSGKSVATVDKR